MKSVIKNLPSLIKKSSVFILLFCLHLHAQSQDTCRVYRNKKLLLTKTSFDYDNPKLVKIKPALAKNENIIIEYGAFNVQKNWQRYIILTNEKEETILSKVFDFSSGRYVLSARDLSNISKNTGKIFLYTYSYPKDPALAATIRIRRLLVCQLDLK